MFSKSWHRVCPWWWNTDDDVSGGFILAVQTTGWQRKQCNLSKGKATAINSFFITVMFSYCSGGRVLSSAEWYISAPHPSPSPCQSLAPCPVTAMIRERWDEYVRRDLILLNATSPVNSCQFCHCRFQTVSRLCVGGWGAAPEGLIFPTAALYWIIPHSLVQLSRGGVKQLTCDMSPQPPSLRKESYFPSAIKVFILLLLPWAIWAIGCTQYCLNTSCFFSWSWSPLVPVEDTNLVLWHSPKGKRDSTLLSSTG